MFRAARGRSPRERRLSVSFRQSCGRRFFSQPEGGLGRLKVTAGRILGQAGAAGAGLWGDQVALLSVASRRARVSR